MSIRGLFLALFAMSSLTGCAVSADRGDDEVTGADDEAVKNRICPEIYKPVCGKNGRTYSNACFAGGTGKVAHDGACTRCDATHCKSGLHCELQDVTCIKAPCEPVPVCVENKPDACAAVRCAAGTHCELQPIVCITTPCDPVAACVADVKPCTMLCIRGAHLVSDATGCRCEPDAKDYCTADSDCKLADDYCGGCNCLALNVSTAPPKCDSPVMCFVEPCRGKTVRCETNHCVAK